MCLFHQHMTDYRPVIPRKPLALGSFLVALLAVTALFVPAFSAHVSVMNKVNIDATSTHYSLEDDGDLRIEITVDNPTRSAFTAKHGLLFGKVDGERVTGLGVDVVPTTVPSGETKTVTARMTVKEEYRDEVAAAIETGRFQVTGRLKGTMQDAQVMIEVGEENDG
jgi:hypothetical protein